MGNEIKCVKSVGKVNHTFEDEVKSPLHRRVWE